jgi:DNA-binding HxlR family transcriptional regulator
VRSYGQYCALAKALDVIGDRWTLLIVRELLLRPSRYRDLRDGLTGVATNLLAERLRHLEDAGVVSRDSQGRYQLTDWGRKLATPIRELIRWAAPLMLQEQGNDEFRARWLEIPLSLMFGGIDRTRPDLQVEIRTSDEMLTLESSQGEVHVRPGPATAPRVVLTGPPDAIVGLLSGGVEQHVATGQGVSVLGDFQQVERLRREDWLDPVPEGAEAGKARRPRKPATPKD